MVDLSTLPPQILDTFPVLPPPTDVKSNFVHPAQNRIGLRLAIYITLPIAISSVLLRLYTRAKRSGGIAIDDVVAVAAMICVCAYCGLLLWMMNDLLGLHLWDIPIRHLDVPFLKAVLASLGLYALSSTLVKICLLTFYYRIFQVNDKARIMIWVAVVFVILLYTTTTGALVYYYLPAKGDGWYSLRSAQTTNALNNVTTSQGFIGAATDFYVLFIPLCFISRLHLPLRRKIGVFAIFLSGLVACICSVVGCVYRYRTHKSLDSFWTTMVPYLLTIVELNVAIVCSSMPIIFVIFRGIFTGDSFFTRLIYYRTRRSKSNMKAGEPTADPSHLEQGRFESNELPEVPRPVMTGMRSFIWKGARAKPAYGDSESSSYHELTSIPGERHG